MRTISTIYVCNAGVWFTGVDHVDLTATGINNQALCDDMSSTWLRLNKIIKVVMSCRK